MNTLKEISDLILRSKKIGITCHESPDGDAAGSTLALLNALKTKNKDAYIISKDKLSDNLRFLKSSNEFTGELISPKEDTDLVVVLDCGNYDRISADLNNFKKNIINLDHHISNEEYGNLNYIDIKAAATTEVVFELLEEMKIDFTKEDDDIKDISTCIYTGLVTDTSAFRHSNVTSRTHDIASKLKAIGVDNTYIYQSLFDNKSFEKIRLIGKALNDMELLLNGKVALIKVPLSYGEELGIEIGDTSDLISFGLQIKGVEVAILVKEAEDKTKISLRSKNKIDVRIIAERLGGGGHIKASGLALRGMKLDDAKNKILEEVEKELI